MTYIVKTEAYKGPMELLLELIKKREMNIYDIEIHVLCQDFLDEMNKMDQVNMEITSEFLSMASLLLRIKSETLLPKTTSQNDEEVEEEVDPRDELVEKILEYEKMKKAQEQLEELVSYEKLAFYRKQEDFSNFDKWELLEDPDINELYKAFKTVMNRYTRHLEAQENLEKIPKAEFTYMEARGLIAKLLNKNQTIYFSDLFKLEPTKEACVTFFLTILELLKNQKLYVRQTGLFEDIEIQSREEYYA